MGVAGRGLEREDDSGVFRDTFSTVGALRIFAERFGALFTEDAVLAGEGENAPRKLLTLETECDSPLLYTL